MSDEELREVLRLLEHAGWQPMVCDTPVPYFDNKVPCGLPNNVGDIVEERKLMPQQWVKGLKDFIVKTTGDSMKDINIVEGDEVRVSTEVPFRDGDVVLVMIDGDFTLKSYFEDENGDVWLVPQNDRYEPMLLKETQNVWLVGVVTEVVKKTPRVSFRKNQRIVAEAKRRKEKPEITEEMVDNAIRDIAPQVTKVRLWYAVFRPMVDLKIFGERDYDAFCARVVQVLPECAPMPSRIELQRMAVDSMAKAVVLWDERNAPVHGKRFDDYLTIAKGVKQMLAWPGKNS